MVGWLAILVLCLAFLLVFVILWMLLVLVCNDLTDWFKDL